MKQLDPVIKTKSSFSILLLRNDSKVVSFRLTPFWIKFLLFFFVVFSGLSGAAGYTAHYYWKKYNNLQRERSELAQILGENRRQLGRFAGIEKIKESTLPRSTMAGITTVAPSNGFQSEPESTPAAAAQQPSPQAIAQSGQPPAQPAGNGQTPAPATPEAAPPAAPVQTATAPQPEQRAEPAAQPLAQSGTPDSPSGPDTAPGGISPEQTVTASGPGAGPALGDEHPALVDEVQIKHAGGNRFRLNFDLSNRNQQLTLNGRIRLAVASKTGDRHEIADVSRDSLRFVINRYKKVTTAFSLPGDMQSTDAETLYVTVTAESVPDVTYRFAFPDL